MDINTLEELLDSLKENIENELESEGLASWAINASGQNIIDNIELLGIEDLKDLQLEIKEGAKIEINIDLSEYVLDCINEIIREHNASKDEEDDEELDFEY